MLQFYILQEDETFVKDNTFNDMYSCNTEIFGIYRNNPGHLFYDFDPHGWQLRASLLKKMMCGIDERWDESRFAPYPFTKREFLKKWKHVYDVCGRHNTAFLRMKWVEE